MKSIQKQSDSLLIAAIALLTAYLFWVALGFSGDMFDAFETFLNAKTIAGLHTGSYFTTRAFVPPILFSPVFRLAHRYAADEAASGLAACHFISMVLFTLLIWCLYKIYKIHLNRSQALAGAFLMMINPLIIHCAPTSKEDIPGTLFITAACYFYLKGRTYDLLGGIAFMLAMGTRYNLIPLFPALILCHLLLVREKAPYARSARLLVLPIALWLLAASVLYWLIGRSSLASAPLLFIRELRTMSQSAIGNGNPSPEYSWANTAFLFKSMSAPLFLAGLGGLWVAGKKRLPGALFHGLWLVIFMIFHSLVLGHKEARYLFPLFPPLYFFVVTGLSEIHGIVMARLKSPALLAGVVLLAMAPSAYLSVRECLKFREQFYRSHFAREVSQYADSLAEKHRVLWFGPFYAFHPKDYFFDDADDMTYLYHLYIHTVRYYTGRPLESYPKRMKIHENTALEGSSESKTAGVFFQPEIAVALQDGDAVILNPEPEAYVTRTVPPQRMPLVVERARIVPFSRARTAVPSAVIYTARELSGARFDVTIADGRFKARAHGFRAGTYEVLLELAGARGRAGVGVFDAPKGEFRFSAPATSIEGGFPDEFLLLYFDSVKTYSPDF